MRSARSSAPDRSRDGRADLTSEGTTVVGALVEVELHVPAASSLKEKRGVLKALIARLRRDLNVSVAEVDHQDLWQRATLGIAIAAGSEIGARKVAQQVENVVSREHRVAVIGIDVEIVATER